MIRRPSRSRASRSAAAWFVLLALAGMVLPATALAQPRPEVAAPSAGLSAPNDCGAADVSGIPPAGTFSISGRVTNSLDEGIEGVRVRARTTTPQVLLADTWTNPDGEFALTDLTDEDFVLSFFDQTATYQNGFLGAAGLTIFASAAAPIDAGANPTGVDVVLPDEPDPLPTISGVILDDLLQPVEGIEVRADSPDFPMSGCGFTDASGAYEMPDVRVGRYVISVTSDAYPDGYYVSAPPTNFATHRTDATLVTVVGSVPGTDIQFPPTFSVSGTIRNALTDPVEGIALSACEVVESGLCSHATSQADGTYTLDALVAGSYVIHQGDPTFAYTSGYHVAGPQGVVSDRSAADVLTIDVADVTGVDLLAVANPRITGTITDAGLVPLEGIEVTACQTVDDFECAQGLTGPGGTFGIGVNPSTYALRIQDPTGDHPSGYVGLAAVLVASEADARQVVVGTSDETIGSVAFAEGGRISGVLRDEGAPAPFRDFGVCLSEFECLAGGQSDENGEFRSAAVMSGTYRLLTFTDEGEQIWYVAGGPPVADIGLATGVTVGTTDLTGVDFDITWTSTTGEPTPEGDDVEVVPTDPGTGGTPVTLSFDHVSGAGETTLAVSDDGPPPPSGFQLGVPPTWFNIETTASFDGLVTVCISYAGVSFVDESLLRLFHYDIGTETWQDKTVSQDLANDVICGRTDTFSPFAILERTMSFTGFEPPLAAPPAVNRVKAGDVVRVGFGLGGDFGLSVLAGGSPASQQTDCTTGLPIGAAEPTTPADKKDHLKYDTKDDVYSYRWKTAKEWSGTCRQLTLTFSNGTTAEASFDFRPEPPPPPKPPKPPKPPTG